MKTTRTATVAERFAARDLQASIRIAELRKAENAAWRARCKADAALVSVLGAQAARRGVDLDWDAYFSQLGI